MSNEVWHLSAIGDPGVLSQGKMWVIQEVKKVHDDSEGIQRGLRHIRGVLRVYLSSGLTKDSKLDTFIHVYKKRVPAEVWDVLLNLSAPKD